MTTALDIDLSLLVGELDAPACESQSHDGHHADLPASHYARATCSKCLMNTIKTYCPTMVALVQMNFRLYCECGDAAPANECVTILGPIKGTP